MVGEGLGAAAPTSLLLGRQALDAGAFAGEAMEEGRPAYRGYIILFSVISLVVGGVVGYFTPRPQRASVPITISTPLPTPTPEPTPTPQPLRIYVSGAVRDPTVYELPCGSIVRDAIEAAGGPLSDADLTCVNLALELQDHQQVHVPRVGEANPPPVISGGSRQGEGGIGALVNINMATAVELETLPGIGEVMARRIVDYREANGPFQTIEDIQNVPGIGPKTFEALKESIVVAP